MKLTTVKGVFRDGRIELREPPPDVERARVIVTFLPESSESGAASPHEVNRRMLTLLQAWQAEPLTADEKRLLDGFGDFQSQHPLRFIYLPDEP